MVFTPPAAGRPARLPEFDGSLSSFADYERRLKEQVAGGLVFEFASAAEAMSVMTSDGAPLGPVFTVTGDSALWTTSSGGAVRIAPAAPMFAAIVGLSWAAGQAWATAKTVSFGGRFSLPPIVMLQPMGQSGSVHDIRPKVMTAGAGDLPDVTAARALITAEADPTPAAAITRYVYVLALQEAS